MAERHKPPLWSDAMYGSAHGEWESKGLLAVVPEDQVKKSRVLELEAALKDMVRKKKDRHELARAYLVNALALGDHGGSRKTGRISVDKFIKVLQRRLRFPLMEAEAKAIFRKYGHDAQGRMPYELFARRLFEGASHVAALEGNRNQPFLKDQPAQWGHQGMIKARPNKRGVYAPSDWKEECREKCKVSASKPDAYLKLEHVYGYSGLKNTAPNLFYTKRGAVVYYTAAVGIVYEKETNTQKFFLRHDDDVQCLTIHFPTWRFFLPQAMNSSRASTWSLLTSSSIASLTTASMCWSKEDLVSVETWPRNSSLKPHLLKKTTQRAGLAR